jgi:CheY-like chemotaxis protein
MNKTILLIDDDADIVEINRAHLQKAGYRVEAAYNGEEGIQKVRAVHPDLIILDVMMATPGEGFEVAQQVRADVSTRDIPILMVTNVNKETGFNLRVGPDQQWNPVDDFIDKPISREVLLQKVASMLK